jgi:hypothetical protein
MKSKYTVSGPSIKPWNKKINRSTRRLAKFNFVCRNTFNKDSYTSSSFQTHHSTALGAMLCSLKKSERIKIPTSIQIYTEHCRGNHHGNINGSVSWSPYVTITVLSIRRSDQLSILDVIFSWGYNRLIFSLSWIAIRIITKKYSNSPYITKTYFWWQIRTLGKLEYKYVRFLATVDQNTSL